MKSRHRFQSERGYTLAVVVVFTTVLLVSLSEAVISWQKAMQREREEELIFRGKQFVRAIELWQRKFPGTFPTTIDALLNTNNLRFLRKKWKDSITNSGEWRLIKLNPDGSISGLTLKPGGGLLGTESAEDGTRQQTEQDSAGSRPSSRTGGQLTNSLGFSRSSPQSGFSQGGQGRSSQSFGSSVFGGIVGVASLSEKKSLKTYNGRSKYNEWEFYYVPRQQFQSPGLGRQRPTPAQGTGGFQPLVPSPATPQDPSQTESP